MMEIANLLLGVGVLATFGVLVWLLRKLEKDRTVKISQLAEGLGLEFHPLGCCVEAIDGTIVYYNILRSGRINRKPEDYPRLLDEAYRLLRLILDR